MDNLTLIVGAIGNLISVFLFLSPVNTFVRIVRSNSTEEFESIPYVCTLLNCSLWTYYGIIKPGALLVATVNGFGVLVELVFVILFLIYAPRQMRVKTTILLLIFTGGFLGVVICSEIMLEGHMRINFVGTIGAAFNIIMYCSPLAAMRRVIRRRNVEYMPFLLSLCTFLNGGVWSVYAILFKDRFILVPNAVGFILGMVQLIIYSRYRRQNQEQEYNEPLV